MTSQLNIDLVDLTTGIQMEYALIGSEDKPVLLFIHDLGTSLHQFLAQQQYFIQDFQVLLLSLRGHGNSSPPTTPTVETYAPREMATDVEALLKYLNLKKVHLIGGGLGGLVSYELLELIPRMILSLTTFATTAELKSNPVNSLINKAKNLFGGGMTSKVTIQKNPISYDPDVRRRLIEMGKALSPKVIDLVGSHLKAYNYTGVIGHHTVPMLMIRGEMDERTNPDLETTLLILQPRPNFRQVEIPEAGQFVNMEKPNMFNPALLGFLHGLGDLTTESESG